MPSMTQLQEFAPSTGIDYSRTHPIFDHIESVETLQYLDLGDDGHHFPTWQSKGTAHLWLAWTPHRLERLARNAPGDHRTSKQRAADEGPYGRIE